MVNYWNFCLIQLVHCEKNKQTKKKTDIICELTETLSFIIIGYSRNELQEPFLLIETFIILQLCKFVRLTSFFHFIYYGFTCLADLCGAQCEMSCSDDGLDLG